VRSRLDFSRREKKINRADEDLFVFVLKKEKKEEEEEVVVKVVSTIASPPLSCFR